MLKIVAGITEYDKYFNDNKFISFTNSYFNDFKEAKWFEDAFVKKIIKDIDDSTVSNGFAVVSNKSGIGYSVNDLSGGSKFLILTHCNRNNVFLATMGDNCTDLLEMIALDNEKNGKDLIIVSNYLHKFRFNYIDSIHYVNFNITCHSWKEVYDKVYTKFGNEMKRLYSGEV